jgi:hypothetical protein
MHYLRIVNGEFGFVVEGIHEIISGDIKITDEDYNKFFELQNQGKQFRLKELSTGTGLFDYIKECEPIPLEVEKTKTDILKEQILDLQELVTNIKYEKLTTGGV